MFERFRDDARRAVVLAQEESRLLDHNYIGTEHLLLGLLRVDDGAAARALEALGIELASVRDAVEANIGRGGSPVSGHIPFTPRAKKVLELSLREALQLGHEYIGTEHILLGLIREGEGGAAQILVRFGAEFDLVRRTVIELLAGQAPTIGRLEARPAASAQVESRQSRAAGRESCRLCGRDQWDSPRVVRAPLGRVCSLCVAGAAAALERSTDREVMMPPRTFGAPEADDVDGIVRAFQIGFGSEPGPEQSELIEDSASVLGAIAEAHRRVGSPPPPVVTVERVRVQGSKAWVRFELDARHLGAFTFEGEAVRVDGVWKVTRETVCAVLRAGGVECAPRAS